MRLEAVNLRAPSHDVTRTGGERGVPHDGNAVDHPAVLVREINPALLGVVLWGLWRLLGWLVRLLRRLRIAVAGITVLRQLRNTRPLLLLTLLLLIWRLLIARWIVSMSRWHTHRERARGKEAACGKPHTIEHL